MWIVVYYFTKCLCYVFSISTLPAGHRIMDMTSLCLSSQLKSRGPLSCTLHRGPGVSKGVE